MLLKVSVRERYIKLLYNYTISAQGLEVRTVRDTLMNEWLWQFNASIRKHGHMSCFRPEKEKLRGDVAQEN